MPSQDLAAGVAPARPARRTARLRSPADTLADMLADTPPDAHAGARARAPALPMLRRAHIRSSGVIEPIRAAATDYPDAGQAVDALCSELDEPGLAGLLFFASGQYNLDELAAALTRRNLDIPVAGCTSAGEIAPDGLREGSITAIGFPAGGYLVDLLHFDALDRFCPTTAQARVRLALAAASSRAGRLWGACHQAAVILVDGLSLREELLAATIHDALGAVPLVGGSAGDRLSFREAYVFHHGAFRRNSAALLLITSAMPMHAFRRQHVRACGPRMVVTRADPDQRLVFELNALPAAEEYARTLGVRPEQLGTELFATHPLMVRAGGEHHVRSVQQANADGSLSFYCAIDNGLVLTLGEDTDQLAGVTELMAELDRRLGGVDHVLAFNCVHNAVACRVRQQEAVLGRLFARHRVVGFNTFGEQSGGLHVNHTLTGLAFAAPARGGHARK